MNLNCSPCPSAYTVSQNGKMNTNLHLYTLRRVRSVKLFAFVVVLFRFQCHSGKGTQQQCPLGTVFSLSLNVCGFPGLVPCPSTSGYNTQSYSSNKVRQGTFLEESTTKPNFSNKICFNWLFNSCSKSVFPSKRNHILKKCKNAVKSKRTNCSSTGNVCVD